MSTSEWARLPVILRCEPFGGILFRPEDAVHVELDHEAFAFMGDYLAGRRGPRSEAERRLLQNVLAEIGTDRIARTREVTFERDVPSYPFQVLNSPTLADFQITTVCPLGCPHCYASAEPEGTSVPLSDIARVFDELEKNGVTQVALGGGEPLSHPDFIPILEMCLSRGMVPNLTTTGVYFDQNRLSAMKRCCGAVALSMEAVGEKFDRRRRTGFTFFKERLDELLGLSIPTVIQVTLSRESFSYLNQIVDFCLGYPELYGVIFLSYKEVGRGRGFDHVLASLPPGSVFEQLRRAFLRLSKQTRVGYDCCLTPAIVGLEPELDFTKQDQLEGCSAMRSSIGILPNLDVTPCTFTTEANILFCRRSNQDFFSLLKS